MFCTVCVCLCVCLCACVCKVCMFVCGCVLYKMHIGLKFDRLWPVCVSYMHVRALDVMMVGYAYMCIHVYLCVFFFPDGGTVPEVWGLWGSGETERTGQVHQQMWGTGEWWPHRLPDGAQERTLLSPGSVPALCWLSPQVMVMTSNLLIYPVVWLTVGAPRGRTYVKKLCFLHKKRAGYANLKMLSKEKL